MESRVPATHPLPVADGAARPTSAPPSPSLPLGLWGVMPSIIPFRPEASAPSPGASSPPAATHETRRPTPRRIRSVRALGHGGVATGREEDTACAKSAGA